MHRQTNFLVNLYWGNKIFRLWISNFLVRKQQEQKPIKPHSISAANLGQFRTNRNFLEWKFCDAQELVEWKTLRCAQFWLLKIWCGRSRPWKNSGVAIRLNKNEEYFIQDSILSVFEIFDSRRFWPWNHGGVTISRENKRISISLVCLQLCRLHFTAPFLP